MVRRKKKLKEKPKEIIRKSKSKKEALKVQAEIVRNERPNFNYSRYESQDEKRVRKAIETTIDSDFLLKSINKHSHKINEKISEVVQRRISEEFCKKVVIEKEKILLKNFNIKDFIHGKYKKHRIVFKSSDFNNTNFSGEPYVVLEKIIVKNGK